MAGVTERPVVREREGARQPAPHCAHVIHTVAFARAALVARRVSRVIRREAAQTDGRQEMSRACGDDSTSPLIVEQLRRKSHREDLIGPQARIGSLPERIDRGRSLVVGAVDDIEQVATVCIPEGLRERRVLESLTSGRRGYSLVRSALTVTQSTLRTTSFAG